jgi:hypothetical protein
MTIRRESYSRPHGIYERPAITSSRDAPSPARAPPIDPGSRHCKSSDQSGGQCPTATSGQSSSRRVFRPLSHLSRARARGEARRGAARRRAARRIRAELWATPPILFQLNSLVDGGTADGGGGRWPLRSSGRALPPGRSQLHGDELVWPLSLRFTRAHEAEPSAAANPARALGRAAGDFFLTDWLAAAASEVGGQLRQDGIATARAWLAAPRANAPIVAARRSQLPRR